MTGRAFPGQSGALMSGDLQLRFKPRWREGLEKRLCGPTGSPVDDRHTKCPQQATIVTVLTGLSCDKCVPWKELGTGLYQR